MTIELNTLLYFMRLIEYAWLLIFLGDTVRVIWLHERRMTTWLWLCVGLCVFACGALFSLSVTLELIHSPLSEVATRHLLIVPLLLLDSCAFIVWRQVQFRNGSQAHQLTSLLTQQSGYLGSARRLINELSGSAQLLVSQYEISEQERVLAQDRLREVEAMLIQSEQLRHKVNTALAEMQA